MAASNNDVLFRVLDPTVKNRLNARLGVHLKAKSLGKDPLSVIGASLSSITGVNRPNPVASPDTIGAHARRLSAWCKITGRGKTSGEQVLAMSTAGFEGRYSSKGRVPFPSLTSVTINRVTTTAERINLTVEILVEYETYTRSDFEVYADAFLRRPESAYPLVIEFGNIDDGTGRGYGKHTLTGAWVIGGGYTQEGSTWKCKFKAIAPAMGILQLDMTGYSSDIITSGVLKFLAISGQNQQQTQTVSSFLELILYFLQQSGTIPTKDLEDGTEVTANAQGLTGTVGKVYKPFEGSPTSDGATAGNSSDSGATSKDTSGMDTGAAEYVTLGFLVELVNKVVIEPVVSSNRSPGLEGLHIEFAPGNKSYIPRDCFKSGNPVDVLFLDGAKACNYAATDEANCGKDFEINVTSNCKAIEGNFVDHPKILIGRKFIFSILEDAIKNYNEVKEQAKLSDKSAALNDLKTQFLSVEAFFTSIFRAISTASGGYVDLVFSYPPDIHSKPASMRVIYILNPTYLSSGATGAPWELLPIQGDGSTLSCTLDGKLPDSMVGLAIQTQIGAGSSTSAVAAGNEDKVGNLSEKDKAYKLLVTTTANTSPAGVFAKMAVSNFAVSDIAAACTALAEYRNLSRPSGWDAGGEGGWTEYFDTELSAELEGVYPIIVGNRFTADSVPKFLRKNLSFVVLDVVDKLEAPGLWTTSIKARLCYHQGAS